jgi:hypothetical protein
MSGGVQGLTPPWPSATEVLTAQLGAAQSVGGKSYNAISWTQDTEINFGPTCKGCGGALTFDNGVAWNLPGGNTSTSNIPVSCSGFTIGNDQLYSGTTYSAGTGNSDMAVLQYTSVPAGYTGTWPPTSGQADLKIDAVKCGIGSGATIVTATPSNFFVGGSATATNRNCVLGKVTGPPSDNSLQASKSYGYTFDYSGGVDMIVVDPEDGNPVTQVIPGTGTDVGTDATIASATGSPQTVSIVPTVLAVDPQFFCVFNGVVYPWGDAFGGQPQGNGTGLDGITPPTAGSGFSLSQCFAAAGWSLFDPVSWVLGSLHDLLCIAEWAVVPSQSSLSGFTGLFRVSSDGGTGAVGVGPWIGSLTTFATGFPASEVSSIKTAADSGSCSLGPTVPVDGHSFTACSALAAGGGSTSWSLIDSIVSVTFLVLIGMALFHLIRRAFSGREV